MISVKELTMKIKIQLIIFVALLLPWSAYANILIISPHPDDDVIIASGVIYRALQRGEPVKVVFMTNGDAGGIENGYNRQIEAVNAESRLGMIEDDIIFLGYPDSHLRDLYTSYPQSSDVYTAPNGQSTTYGNRGLGRTDYHTYYFGFPAQYNGYNVVLDLKTIINSFRPDHIFTTCPYDSDDHKRTYQFMSMALSDLFIEVLDYNPTIHKTTVWPGQSSWPNSFDPTAYFDEIPDFSSTSGLMWSERESLDVPILMQSTFYPENPKHLAIDEHVSQNGSYTYLGRFIHKDEFFWVERHRGENQPPVVNAGNDQFVNEASQVSLDANGSFDLNGDTLSYSWRQVTGPEVTLSSYNSPNPSFTAPEGLLYDEIISFELIVSDEISSSVPDAVNVIVHSQNEQPNYVNIAPLAADITASSVHSSSDILNVVDSCVSGYPDDASCEWITQGEKDGAWVEFSWDNSFSIGKIIFYDRPNFSDQVTKGRIIFSDGSSMEVGPFENKGRPVEYTFPPHFISGLRLEITETSSRTANVGLAELEIFEVNGDNINHTPIADAGTDQTVGEGETVVLDGSLSSDIDAD